MWFIGRLSATAIAAMGAIYWLMSFFIFVLGGVGFAVQSFVSQALGSRRRRRAAQFGWQSLWAALVALPLFAAVAAAGGALLRPFGLAPQIEALAILYWEPRMLGAVFGVATWGLMGFFNGVGATRITLALALLTVGVNFPANQYLMFELGLGMAGSAWATTLAQLVGLLAAIAFLLGPRFRRDYSSALMWRPRWRRIRSLLLVGLPVGVMYGADILGVAVFQIMITLGGTVPAAATQIVMTLTSLAYMPTLGIASAGTTLVGQCIGMGERDWGRRIGNVIIATCSGTMGGVALLLLIGAPWILPRFVAAADPAATAVTQLGTTLLWIAAAYQMFDGLYFGSSFCLRAAGDTRVPAMTALLLSWLFFVPLAHTLIFAPGAGWSSAFPGLGLGAVGGWLALMGYAMLLGVLMLLRWRSGRWQALRIA
jgi:MATE family multidrug resistance protein